MVDINPPIPPVDGMNIDEDPPSADIKIVVLDGIVMGPTGSFCAWIFASSERLRRAICTVLSYPHV
jgi:hypothetical protein